MQTRALDFTAPVRRTDPVTSHVAAASVQRKVKPQVLKLLDLIRQYPDRTAGELAAASMGELDFHTVCRRVSALERADLIEIDNVGRECRVRGTVQRTYRVKPGSEAADA